MKPSLFFAIAGFISLTAFSSCGEIEHIELDIDQPIDVQAGEIFQTTISISNTASFHQELYSIDIADEYLEGILLVESEPQFKESSHVPIDETESYRYNLTIAPHQTLEVLLTFKATQSGVYRGDADFCINSDYNFISFPLRTVVN